MLQSFKFQKIFVLNPKLLTKNYQILEIIDIKVIKKNKNKNKIKLIKKKCFFEKEKILKIEINKDLHKLEILDLKKLKII